MMHLAIVFVHTTHIYVIVLGYGGEMNVMIVFLKQVLT